METYRYYSLPFCQSHSSAEVEAQVAEEEAGTSMTHRLAETTKREGGIRHKQRMGESIVGDRRETSPYEISFMDSVDWRLLCQEELDAEDLTKFKEAIHNNYFFEMFVEDLPMWGYIGDAIDEDIILGESDSSRTFLFPHLHFVLGYNQKRIVSAKVTTDVRTLLICLVCCIVGRARCQLSLIECHYFAKLLQRKFYRWTVVWTLPMSTSPKLYPFPTR